MRLRFFHLFWSDLLYQPKVLGSSPSTKIELLLYEGALVPAGESEFVGGGYKERVFLLPFEHVHGNDSHGWWDRFFV